MPNESGCFSEINGFLLAIIIHVSSPLFHANAGGLYSSPADKSVRFFGNFAIFCPARPGPARAERLFVSPANNWFIIYASVFPSYVKDDFRGSRAMTAANKLQNLLLLLPLPLLPATYKW